MARLSRVVAAVGLAVLVAALVLWWTGRPDHGGGDAETLATGLDVPWGLALLPTGDALVGERESGRIYRVPADGGDPVLVATVPGVSADGEGGLLGLALDPLFIHSGHSFVYAYLTTDTDNRIVRFHLDPDGPTIYDEQVLLDGIAKNSFHNGGGLAWGQDGMLYAGTGDAGVPDRAQDPDSLNGKILRMDGLGNAPLIDPNPDPASLVYSLGHRNVQGLAWDADGRLWATEFGQDTFDEVNLVEPGDNDGWPEVEGVGDTHGGRFVNPLVTWSTDEASPSGAAIVGDTLYVGALRGQRLWAVPLDGARAGAPVALLEGQYGRLRTVTAAPDGSVWITTSNRDGRGDPDGDDDRVLRFDPGAVSQPPFRPRGGGRATVSAVGRWASNRLVRGNGGWLTAPGRSRRRKWSGDLSTVSPGWIHAFDATPVGLKGSESSSSRASAGVRKSSRLRGLRLSLVATCSR